eukprot:gene13491-biopygen42
MVCRTTLFPTRFLQAAGQRHFGFGALVMDEGGGRSGQARVEFFFGRAQDVFAVKIAERLAGKLLRAGVMLFDHGAEARPHPLGMLRREQKTVRWKITKLKPLYPQPINMYPN